MENDIAIDIAGTKSIDLDVLQYVPDIANEPKAMEMVAELIAKLPDREIDGNLSPELEAKVWEKRMPQLSEEEKLAVEFDRLCFDYDEILYHDTVRNMSENVEELVLCQDLVQVKMRNFSHFNPPEAQPQCVFFHTIVRIHLVTYSYNGYEFVSYCRKLPDIRKSSGMLAYNHGF